MAGQRPWRCADRPRHLPMTNLPPLARLYVITVIAAGGLVLAACLPLATFERPWLLLALVALSSATSVMKVNLPFARSGSTMSVSYAVDFASLLLLGAHETMLVALVSAWSQCTFRSKTRNPFYRTVFSMACLAITVQAAGRVYEGLGGVPGHIGVEIAGPLVGAATTYFLVNTVMVAMAIALSSRQAIGSVWHDSFLWSAPSYFVGATAAAGAWAVFHHSVYSLVPLIVAPLYLTYRTYKVYLGRIDDQRRHVKQMADLYLATIEALARAIDAKDQMSQGHIRRVQVFAEGLARAISMSEAEIQAVRTGALLHDIGKLGVPEHILSKPGPLTPEEFQKVRAHPRIGAEIIEAVPFPYPVAPLILSHHERWDGRGYPSGLKGPDIPVGARILAVVDYFDALMSERPYHKAMDAESAIALIKQEAGHGLDPKLVELFTERLPVFLKEAGAVEQHLARRVNEAQTLQAAPNAATRGSSVFEDIALAHREIYALYEMAQAMSSTLGITDTMSIISSKLSNLVPFSSCALFLHDHESETLRCRYVVGEDADVIQQLVVPNGDGLTGWVARNRRSLLNARPSADLEAAGLTTCQTKLKAALVCPLVFGDRFIGTLATYHETENFYSEDHRRLLDRISEQAAAVLHNSIMFEQTQEDSLTDPLTGLPNTRSLFMHLARELARAERLRAPVSLLVMDLDEFKDINDTYGHHVGDLALCEVARVLRAGIRPYDICVRYAGDEFIVVLSGCGPEEAEHKRLELQQAVEEVFLEASPGNRVWLSMSIGAAVFPGDGEVYETLLATADQRMYQDKSRRQHRPDQQSEDRSEAFVTAGARAPRERPPTHTNPI